MGQIKVEKNVGGIEGLCVVEPAVHGDARGYFMETYNEKDMKEAGIDIHFVQDNQSMSTKGVLRGLHFQKQYPQCKLVRAVRGTVFDVAVDLRSDSATRSTISGIRMMRVVWHGMTRRSALNGRNRMANTRAVQAQRAIRWKTVRH